MSLAHQLLEAHLAEMFGWKRDEEAVKDYHHFRRMAKHQAIRAQARKYDEEAAATPKFQDVPDAIDHGHPAVQAAKTILKLYPKNGDSGDDYQHGEMRQGNFDGEHANPEIIAAQVLQKAGVLPVHGNRYGASELNHVDLDQEGNLRAHYHGEDSFGYYTQRAGKVFTYPG